MTLGSFLGEVAGSAFSSYLKTKSRLEQCPVKRARDYCSDEVKVHVVNNLNDCLPAQDQVGFFSRKGLVSSLKKRDLLGSHLSIDAGRQTTARAICISALKLAAICICNGHDVSIIESATYSYLAGKYIG